MPGIPAQASSGQRSPDRWVIAGLVLFVAAVVLGLVASRVRLTQEDGFYYFAIARRLAAGEGSTFDGLHLTNGYHPLWMACLVPVFWALPDPDAALVGGTLLQGSLLAAGAVLAYSVGRECGLGALAASLVALLWFGLVYGVALSGVEFALQSLCLLAAAWIWRRSFAEGPAPTRRSHAVLGVVLALAFLARLDALLLVAFIGLSLLGRGQRARRPGSLAAIGAFAAGPAAAGLGYAAVQLHVFGHLFPVSGMAKRLWSGRLLAQDPSFLSGGWLAAKASLCRTAIEHVGGWQVRALLLGSVGAGALWLLGSRRGRTGAWVDPIGRVLRPFGPFVAFSVGQLAAYVAVFHGAHVFARWYYGIQPFLAALIVGAVLDSSAPASLRPSARWPHLGRSLRVLLAGLALCAVVVATLRSAQRSERGESARREEPLYLAARWARENLPADARIGTWNAGAIGYLSRRQVVNLDGVVNTRRFLEVDQYDLCRYWEDVGLTHLVDVFEAREGSKAMTSSALPVTTYYARCADRLDLIWSDGDEGDPGRARAFRILAPGRS